MLARLRRTVSLAEPPLRIEALWLRLLGLIYLTAFASMLPQIQALVGSSGIAPAATWMAQFHAGMGNQAYFALPSVFWLDASDSALISVCIIGCVAAAVLASGFITRSSAAICWFLYLSIAVAGQPFTDFQWDALLLEAGFLALFSGTPLLVWAYRFLLFRLLFESGIVKLSSHDPNWRNLHALRFHFLTQPLPNPIAYYAFRLPARLLDATTAVTLFIELICPFFLFAPKRFRIPAVGVVILLQLVIIATGNYAFFNLLTIALCVWALDDPLLAPISKWLRPVRSAIKNRIAIVATSVALCALMLIGALQLVRPELTPEIVSHTEIVNTYGLFAVMTTTRPELVIEGSNDNVTWKEYTFRYKPGPLNRSLPVVAPYQPRLDWQMWFAALGTYQENTWVGGLLFRLLTGDHGVLGLLEAPPFASAPRSLRVLLYDYRFTAPAERARTGALWERSLLGTWYGPVALRPASH